MNNPRQAERKSLSSNRQQWRRLMVIALSGSAMIATPQLAHAAFTENPPASGQYTASGAEVTAQTLNANNAQVTTDNTFSVNAPTGIALNITGQGALSYTDTNAATLLTNGTQYGLNVDVTGDAPGPVPGSITIQTNGNITGGGGVNAVNSGSGSIQVTTTGVVTGNTDNGVNVIVGVNGNDLEVNTGQVTGQVFGIATANNGSGDTIITTNGTVTGTTQSGIRAYNATTAGALTVDANADVISTGNHGIDVENNGTGNTEVNATNVTGLQHGIHAENHYAGNLSITTTGTVTATNLDGINATNTANTGNLTVEVNAVDAGRHGINTSNNGTGNTEITATGTIEATNGHGINAVNGATSVNLTVETVAVTSGMSAINTSNNGTGNTDITATGAINVTNGHGINAVNGATSVDMTVETAAVTSNQHAINTSNNGTGNTQITANGLVTSTADNGVNIVNGATAGNLTVETAAVTGAQFGVITSNSSTTGGNTEITTNGVVTGTAQSGIRANNASATSGSLTVTANANVVSTGNHGIDVENSGTGNTTVGVINVNGLQHGVHAVNRTAGNLSVTSTGIVNATNQDGVNATNEANTGNLTVEVNTVTAGRHGVGTLNNGTGTTEIDINGVVTGTANNGVNAVAGATAGNLTVTVAATGQAIGGEYGVATRNNGLGTTTINIDGLAQGGNAGVLVNSSGSQAIEINVEGTVRNTSQASNALAIYSDTSPVTINNSNLILGTVSLGNQGNSFNNSDTWSTAGGTSTLGAGINTLDNQLNANILAATTTGSVNTTVTGVGTFIHSGDLVLQNTDVRIGGLTTYTGDVATFTNGGSGEFQSNNGALFIDTDLENSTSDRIAVDNVVVTGGSTVVNVNAFGPGRATSGDGILVVDVDGGSANDAFVLAAPIQAGLFDYNLNQGQSDTQSWFLQSSFRDEVVAAGALSVLGSRTALATLSNLNERQRGGEGFSDDQEARKGVWARAYGQGSKFSSDGGTQAGFDANTWGAQAGLDLLAKGNENGARKYAGIYIGYATSNGDALNGSRRVGSLDVDATSVGAYFTKYSPKGWYADATAQYSKLNGIRIRTAENSLDPDGKSYAFSLEAGQRFNLDKKIIPELQAQLIYQKTDIDDVTLSDSTRLAIGNVNAVTGRLGVRLSKNPEYAGRFQPWVRANLWRTFKTGARISSQGAGADTHVGGTSGEVQLGFALTPSQSGGWSAYVAGGYLFDLSGSEYSGWKGTLGVRKGW